MKRKIAIIFVYLLFWFAVLLMLAITIREPGIEPNKKWTFAFVTLATGLLSFFLQFYLSRRYIYDGFSGKWFFASALTVIAIAFFYYLLLENNFKERGNYSIEYPFYYSLPVAIFFSLSGIMFRGFQHTFVQRQKEQQLQTDKLSLELNLIRTQLNPHFLFNVLNNVDGFIRTDAAKASDSIIRLSSLLRYLLYETAQAYVPLQSEIKFIEDYIDLQRQRLQYPEHCNFRKELSDSERMIAPALFLPYIENAFIHCPVNERGAMLNFAIKTGPDKTVFTAQNTKANTFPSGKDKGGIGMVLAKKRLDVLYPNRHSLHIVPAETMFIVEVIIYHNES